MTQLLGAQELRARLKALKLTYKEVGSRWGDDAVVRMQERVHSPHGRLKKSIRVKNRTQRKTTIAASYWALMINKGSRAHTIPKRKHPRLLTSGYQKGSRKPTGPGGTIFGRKAEHRGHRAWPFIENSAREALDAHPETQAIIDAWNSAAGTESGLHVIGVGSGMRGRELRRRP